MQYVGLRPASVSEMPAANFCAHLGLKVPIAPNPFQHGALQL